MPSDFLCKDTASFATTRFHLPRHALRLAGSAGFLALISAAAFAQTPSAASDQTLLDTINVQASSDGEGGGVGPALNTPSNAGSRLGLTALETPASVDIIDGETARERGINDVNQAIVRNGVGINFLGAPGNGGTSLGMRGFAGHGSLTRLYDGVKIYPGSGTITFPFDMWTVERVEILRGPASVLSGEGAIGGTINVVAKKPLTDRTRNEVQAMIGTDGHKGLAFGSAGPINEYLAYNIDISGKGSDGWVERGDAKSLAISGALRWQASEDLAVTLSHDYGYNKPTAYFGTPLIDGKLDERLRRKNYNVSDALVRFNDNITQLNAEWTPTENLTINSSTYYMSSDRDWRNVESYLYRPLTDDIRRTSYIAINHKYEHIGHRSDATFESRFAGMKNRTVVGFDINSIRFRNTNNSPYAGSSVVDPLNFDPGLFGPHRLVTTLDSRTLQYSLFADNRLEINDQWALVGGLRYDNPRLKRTDPRTGDSFTRNYESLNWRIGAVYTPMPDVAFYAQYSQASEPIGNIISVSAAQAVNRLTRGEQVEAGVKFSFLDGRADATLSAYHIRKKDLLSTDPNAPTGSDPLQIGQQSSQGIEAAIGFDIGHGFRVEANGTILKARFSDFLTEDDDGNRFDYSGNTPPNVPQHAANLFVSWAFAENWLVHGGVHYVGKTYTSNNNTTSRPAYSVVNAGLQWQPKENLSFDLNVYNLFDEVYATSGGSTQWMLAPRRSATLSTRFTF